MYGERSKTLAGQEMMTAILKSVNLEQPRGAGISFPVQTQTQPQTQPQTQKPPVTQSGTTEFIDIISRDEGLSIPPTSYVPQNTPPTKKVTIELFEGEVYIGQGVMFRGFVTNGKVPGPTIIVDEGDIVEFTVVNKGQVPHGASIHSAYTQTSKYLGKIPAGESKTMVFKVPIPGVYMYHCAPGGHGIPMHVLFGQYGMMVVRPKKQYRLEQILNKKPDVELFLLQHEYYASGKDAIEGNPLYVAFNGKLFKYVEEPVKAKPGDYVRINFLNVGPNLLSTFHIVGIIWDFAYWQGHPDAVFPNGQSVTAGPTDSWVIEFRVPPDEGSYTMLTHAVGSTDRGAIGLLNCVKDAPTPVTILADGPTYTDAEMKDIKAKVLRTFSPFEPGTPDVDPPQKHGKADKEVIVKIIGNSYYPKVLHIEEGTTVKWINEDIFTYMDGEFGGVHKPQSLSILKVNINICVLRIRICAVL
jgi:nitrite reductase (NO-forming)